mmetsp:Transcript_333/g.833  ORF Transcript_333/g.833 Transcript_333/m.833 type:complete len:705 (-) Transcript_333:365-2479(-)
MPPPLHIPVLKVEGQGLSKKQTADVKQMEKSALAWTASNGRRFEDAAFPASAESLGPELAGKVDRWLRPHEFAQKPELFKNFWEIEGVKPGVLDDRWFLGALNIVAGNKDNIDRLFLSATKAEGGRDPMAPLAEQAAREGFYIVRFYEDDPRSDDDWVCVLVDDRIPCDASGKPAFARCPDDNVFWVMIVEKAYAKMCGGYHKIGQHEVEYGLELLCGGVADDPVDLTSASGRELIPGGASPNALWNLLMEKVYTNHAIGAEYTGRPDPSAPELPHKEMLGITRDQPYSLLVANEVRSAGKLIKMRTFRGDSEWRGKWSDDSEHWTNSLRQMLSYSSDTDDGSFWMEYDDFCEYFNRVWFVRMADDRWTRFTVRSSWEDAHAGGSMAFASWVHNRQWRLRVPPGTKPARVVLTLTVPERPKKVDGAPGAPGQYTNALGLEVLRGNEGDDRKRQRLELRSRDDVVHRVEPRFARKIVTEVLLEPDDTPYLLRPFLATPGRESPFTLTVLSDDKNDDGIPDFEFAYIDEADNWRRTWLVDAWDKETAGGPLSAPTWEISPQFQLTVRESRTRVFLLLELIDFDTDGRDEAGMQDVWAELPAVQVAVCEGKGKNVPLSAADGAPTVLYAKRSKDVYPDGLILELPVDGLPRSDTPYIVIPMTSEAGVKHKFAISCYSNLPVDFSKVVPDPCNWCPGDCKQCPMVQVR